MAIIYLGVHLPFKPYQKLKVDNVDLTSGTESLRTVAAKLIKSDVAKDDFVFIYCGTQLNTDDTLQSKGIGDGSMIHVVQKRREPDDSAAGQQEPFTEADVQEVLGIWRTVDSSNFQKVRQPEFMKNALDAHPAIRGDLFVLSMLKDPILLSSMQQPETIRRVAEKHRVLIDASRAIVQLLNSKILLKVNNYHLSAPMDNALDDPLSDSSSSDENTASPTTSSAVTLRRITPEQLASALAFATGSGPTAGSGSYNSLSNISQRDADSRESQQEQTGMEATTSQPSTSGTAGAGSAAATAGNVSSTDRNITSSMMMDAISMIFQQRDQQQREEAGGASASGSAAGSGGESSSRPLPTGTDEPMDTSPPAAAPGADEAAAAPMGDDLGAQTQSQHTSIAARMGRYRTELELMREMGLADTENNLQALIVCNGNVESAVNLVLSCMNN